MAGLTTLQRMKDYMGIPSPTNPQTDATLTMFINSASSNIMAYLERGSFISQPYKDIFNGENSQHRFPRYWPVTSVLNVQVDNMVIPPVQSQQPAPMTADSGAAPSAGWVFEPWNGIPPGRHQSVALNSFVYRRGHLNCQIDYVAGYLVTETYTIDATGATHVTQQPYGAWIADGGVTFVDTGNHLTPVTVTPPVASGTYYLDPLVVGGYQFAVVDAGRVVTISYSYVPAGIEQATWEMVALSYSRRQHPGQRSRSLAAQESVTYDLSGGGGGGAPGSGLPSYVTEALAPYKNVIPE
jgi:hypothetical protein